MYRWSCGALKRFNSWKILGCNRCAADGPAGYECIEPKVLAAMPSQETSALEAKFLSPLRPAARG
jgi:hypothetical protein